MEKKSIREVILEEKIEFKEDLDILLDLKTNGMGKKCQNRIYLWRMFVRKQKRN